MIDDLSQAVELMKKESDLNKKLFLFSACYGSTSKTIKFEYDRELLLLDLILQHTYSQLIARVGLLAKGEKTVPLTPDVFNDLTACIDDLVLRLKKGQNVYPVLQSLIEIAFKTTGPGYYMELTGKLKPQSSIT